jgi:hypothetical protein
MSTIFLTNPSSKAAGSVTPEVGSQQWKCLNLESPLRRLLVKRLRGLSPQAHLPQSTHQLLIFGDQLRASSLVPLDFKQPLHQIGIGSHSSLQVGYGWFTANIIGNVPGTKLVKTAQSCLELIDGPRGFLSVAFLIARAGSLRTWRLEASDRRQPPCASCRTSVARAWRCCREFHKASCWPGARVRAHRRSIRREFRAGSLRLQPQSRECRSHPPA